jgi:hypothetical protein
MDGTNNTANNAANINNINDIININNNDEIDDWYNDSIANDIFETTHWFDKWVDDEVYFEIYHGIDNEFLNWGKYFIDDEIDYSDSYEDEIYDEIFNTNTYNEIYNNESYNEIIYNIFDNNNNTTNNATNNNDLLHEILHEIEINHPVSFEQLGTDLDDVIVEIQEETNDPIEIRAHVEIFLNHYEDDDYDDPNDFYFGYNNNNDDDNNNNNNFFDNWIDNHINNFIWGRSPNYPGFEIKLGTLVIRNIETQIEVPVITRRDGYKVIILNGHMVYYHRFIAEIFVPNSDPTTRTKVDHIDRNRNNNFPSNLQSVTPSINNLNKWIR